MAVTPSFTGRGPPATGGSLRQTPCLPCAEKRSPWVATGCRLACLSRFRGCRICDRLPPVAPAWLFLKKGRVSSHRCSFTSFRAPERSGSSLSWRCWTHTVSVGAVSASQFHKGPSGGQSQAGACRNRGGAGSWRGFEGFVAGEHVPGGDQDLARDRGFRGVVVARAAADVEVELVPGVRFAPGLLGGLDRSPAEQPRARLVQRTGVRPTFTGLA